MFTKWLTIVLHTKPLKQSFAKIVKAWISGKQFTLLGFFYLESSPNIRERISLKYFIYFIELKEQLKLEPTRCECIFSREYSLFSPTAQQRSFLKYSIPLFQRQQNFAASHKVTTVTFRTSAKGLHRLYH